MAYANRFRPFIINDLHMQYDIQDRRKVYAILQQEGIELPRFAILDRDSADPKGKYYLIACQQFCKFTITPLHFPHFLV